MSLQAEPKEEKLFQLPDRKFKALEIDALPEDVKKFGKRVIGAWAFFLLFVLVTPWVQTAPGSGRVIAYNPNEREQEISATIDGIVKTWFVGEGSYVKVGDPIVELSDNDPSLSKRLEMERNALFQRVKATEMAAETAQLNVKRQDDLFKQGLSAKRELEQAKIEYTRHLVDAANAAAELARIDVRVSRQNTQKIVSPIAGTILRVVAGEGGRLVKSGQMLALIVPDTQSRALEIWVDGNDVALIQEKSRVRIQFEGWPAVQFSGWPSVAVGTFAGVVRYIDPSDVSTGKFRVLIEPDPEQKWPEGRFLRQGVRALAWIQLNRVSLAYEFWRLANGFPANIGEKPKTITPSGTNPKGGLKK